MKLSPQAVKTIRRLRGEGFKTSELASYFGVSHETIRRVLRRESWGWLEEEEGGKSLEEMAKASQERLLHSLSLVDSGEEDLRKLHEAEAHRLDVMLEKQEENQ